MSINYPTSLDDTTSLPTRATSDTIPAVDSNDPKSAIIQLETKLGTGASTPTTSGHVLRVTGAGATAYGAVAQADVTGLTTDLAAKVPTTRTVNSHALSADISLTASDVGAVPTTRTVNGHALSANVTVSADDVLPTQTGNNGKFLTTNGTTSSWDTPAGGATDNISASTTRAIVKNADPNYGSALVVEDTSDYTATQNLVFPAGFILYGNAGNNGAGTFDKYLDFTSDDLNIVTPGSGVLKLNGTAVGGGSAPRVTVSTNFENSSRFGIGNTGTSSAVTFDGTGVLLAPGTTGTGYANVWDDGLPYLSSIFDRNPHFWFIGDSYAFTASNTWDWYTVLNSASNGTSLIETRKHIGFNIRNNNGTQEVYASNADGTTQTKTLLSGVDTNGNPHIFLAKMTSGTKIEFFVDGVLKATHTTNLPTGNLTHHFHQSAIISSAGTANDNVHMSALGMTFEQGA